jgi:hypothetical protein
MKRTVLISLLVAGCVGAPIDTTGEDAVSAVAGKADGITAAPTGNPANATRYYVLHAQDYSVTNTADRPEGTHPYGGFIPGFFNPGGSTGPVAEAGKPLVLVYDRHESITYQPPPRCFDEISGIYTDCGSESYGEYIYTQYQKRELHYRIDGGAVTMLEVPTGNPGVEIAVPATARGEIEYWFALTRTDGQVEWDSKWGKNHHINVLPPATGTIVFDENWGETLNGSVRAGQSVKLDYDRDRLIPTLKRVGNINYDNYSVRAFALVSFDGGAAAEYPVDIGFSVTQMPLVEVPAGARQMSVWIKGQVQVFKSGGYEWRDAYDSNFGTNYRFSVTR